MEQHLISDKQAWHWISAENEEAANLDVIAAQTYGQIAQIAYLSLSPQLTITGRSKNFERLYGEILPLDVGQNGFEHLWELGGQEVVFAELMQGARQTFSIQNINRLRADGSVTYINLHLSLLDSKRPEEGFLVILVDVSHQGALQQQLTQEKNDLQLLKQKLEEQNRELRKLDRVKSTFLSMAAHDLRTPLMAIVGYSDLIRELTPPHNDSHEFLEKINQNSERLNRIIDDLLDLDQIEQGVLKLNVEVFPFAQLVEMVSDGLRATVAFRNQTLQIEIPPDLLLAADPARVERIINNLVSNGVKYTPPGGTIKVVASQTATHTIFSVADNGYGMSATQVAELFNLYYRTSDARNRKIRGSGVGLFIVKALVDAHKGTIDVHSIPDKGTTFTLSFPRPA